MLLLSIQLFIMFASGSSSYMIDKYSISFVLNNYSIIETSVSIYVSSIEYNRFILNKAEISCG